MNNIWIVLTIFIASILIALIIKMILNYQDEKEEWENSKNTDKEDNKKQIPESSILTDDHENNLKQLLTNFKRKENDFEIPIGWNEKQETRTIDFNKNNHILIIGTTGGGKSICLNEMISSTIMNYHSEEIKIVTMDTSMVELSSFNGIPHYVKNTIISPNDVIEEIEEIQKEIKHRIKDNKYPELLIFIDDFYDICSYDSKVLKTIIQLLEDSKEKNIHFIIATDTPSEEIITDELKDQIDGTIFLTLSPGEKKDFDLDITKSDIEYLTEIGHAIYKTKEKKEKIIIPEVLEEEIKEIKNCYSKY